MKNFLKNDLKIAILLGSTTLLIAGQDMLNDRCTLCPSGFNFSKPEFVINGIPNVPEGTTCATVASLVPLFFAADSDECQATHGVLSALCGCDASILENPCSLCNEHIDTLRPKVPVPRASSLLFENLIPEPTCEIVQAYLTASRIEADTETCGTATSVSKDGLCCGRSNATTPFAVSNVPTYGDLGPTATVISSQPCSLCGGSGDSIMYPDRLIVTEPALFPNCGVAAAAVSLLSSDDQQCYDVQALLGIYCGCPNAEITEPQERCSICHNRSPMTEPNTLLHPVVHRFNGVAPSCALYESVLEFFTQGSEECNFASPLGFECGCQPVEDHCVICPGGIKEEHYGDMLGGGLSCEEYQYSQYFQHETSVECFYLKQPAHLCGCRDGLWHYAGTETRTQQALLAWLPRFTSLLSIIGSVAILWDILHSRTQNASHMYHQIMVAISISDLVFSSASMLTSLAVQSGEDVAGFVPYGAKGSKETCIAQAFFLTLGTASAWYNLSLSIYYKLVILDGWREATFTPCIRAMLLGVPAVIGVVLASAGIPYYVPAALNCSIAVIPWEEKKHAILWIGLIPSSFVVLAVTIVTAYTFYKFQRQLEASDKWKFSARAQAIRSSNGTAATEGRSRNSGILDVDENETDGRTCCSAGGGCWPIYYILNVKQRLFESSLKGQVLRQSSFYLLAFYGSFPISTVVAILTTNLVISYPLTLIATVLVPVQGFNNALIYFRPRASSRWENLKKSVVKLRKTEKLLLGRKLAAPTFPSQSLHPTFTQPSHSPPA